MKRIAYYFKFLASSDFIYAFELSLARLSPLNNGNSFNSVNAFISWAVANHFTHAARLSSMHLSILENSQLQIGLDATKSRDTSETIVDQGTNRRRSKRTSKNRAKRQGPQTSKGHS